MFLSGLLVALLYPFLAPAGRTVGFTDTSPPRPIVDGPRNPSVACAPAYGHPNANDCAGAALKLGHALGIAGGLGAIDRQPESFMLPKEFMFPDVQQRFTWAEPFNVPIAFKAGIGMGGVQRIGEENRLGVSFYGTDSTLREVKMLNQWCAKTKDDNRCNLQGKLPSTGPGSSASSSSTEGAAKTCSRWATRGIDCCQGSTFKSTPVTASLRALMFGIQQALVAGASEGIGWCTAVGS
ncbi:MAG: hypothetical protein M1812_004279 [Candelaria pacifica]|nr:MAG: hypothetical protein M1812_004279 [Candelaria pacifica]